MRQEVSRTVIAFVLGAALAVPATLVLAKAAHPQIVAAQKALGTAKMHLNKAAHDFDGHRVKAIQLIEQAEGELKAALDWAAAHPDEFKKGAAAPASH